MIPLFTGMERLRKRCLFPCKEVFWKIRSIGRSAVSALLIDKPDDPNKILEKGRSNRTI